MTATPPPDEAAARRYVDAAALALGLDLPADALERVAAQYLRLAGIAAPLVANDLPDEAEIAPTFRP